MVLTLTHEYIGIFLLQGGSCYLQLLTMVITLFKSAYNSALAIYLSSFTMVSRDLGVNTWVHEYPYLYHSGFFLSKSTHHGALTL